MKFHREFLCKSQKTIKQNPKSVNNLLLLTIQVLEFVFFDCWNLPILIGYDLNSSTNTSISNGFAHRF